MASTPDRLTGTPREVVVGVVDYQVEVIDVGPLLAHLADREIDVRDTEPDERMELDTRIAVGRRFSTSFAGEAEHAVTVLGKRLSEATSTAGERGDG